MPPHVQLVMGPAGVGKSTYCEALQTHGAMERRRVFVANLDPAAERAPYTVSFDMRDLITVQDVMEELDLGPNGSEHSSPCFGRGSAARTMAAASFSPLDLLLCAVLPLLRPQSLPSSSSRPIIAMVV